MTARLTLVCSGATAATRNAAFPLDEPLEDGATDKAAALRTRLPSAAGSLTSPALRAIQTAEALGLAPAVEPRLRDWDLGNWAGRRIDDLGAEDREGVASWLADPAGAPHGGESLLDLLGRVGAYLDECLARGGRVVALTHPAVIRAAMLHVLAAPPQSFWRIDIEPLSLTSFTGNGVRWTLRQRPWGA